MDHSSLFGDQDTFSSLEDELICNVKRPSLISLSSNDTLGDSDTSVIEIDKQLNSLHCSTPYVKVGANDRDNNCQYRTRGNFPLTRDNKRYSLSIFQEDPADYMMNKSVSMLDVSAVPEFPSLPRDSIGLSTETLHSNSMCTTKSKDSGFQRSTSCNSLVSGIKKYDHVQSKVKQYIQNIKQSEALHKMQKQLSLDSDRRNVTSFDSSPTNSDSVPISKRDLLHKVKELEEEIKEKDDVIEQLEKDHTKLKMKYADAENKIDDLRVKVSCTDKKKNMLTDEKLAEMLFGSKIKANENYYASSFVKSSPKCEINKLASHDSLLKQNNCGKWEQFDKSVSIKKTQKQPLHTKVKYCNGTTSLFPSAINVSKSASCKNITDDRTTTFIQKSVSNATVAAKQKRHTLDLPYDTNSFDKVHRWQRSLLNIDQKGIANDNTLLDPVSVKQIAPVIKKSAVMSRKDHPLSSKCSMDVVTHQERKDCYGNCHAFKEHNSSSSTCQHLDPCNDNKARIRNITDKPVPSKRRLLRSVSFASYDDSLTSSFYDDEDSSSNNSSSLVFTPLRHQERYKDFKQRKLHERRFKQISSIEGMFGDESKAKSAGNLCYELNKLPSYSDCRNKRAVDVRSSCNCCRCINKMKHNISQCDTSPKYRKISEANKIASNPVVKCKTVHVCEKTFSAEIPHCSQTHVLHSKSYDVLDRRNTNNICVNATECSCLIALEKLRIQEKDNLDKFSEHVKKHANRSKEKNVTKRHSLHK